MQVCRQAFTVFYYSGNIAFDISGISTKVPHENMWLSHFCSFNNALLYITTKTHALGNMHK